MRSGDTAIHDDLSNQYSSNSNMNDGPDAPPDDTNVRSVDFALCLVDVRNTLSEIKLRVLLRCYSLDLHEGSVRP